MKPEEVPPWPDLIAEMGLLRQRVSAVKDEFPFTIPHLAATDDELRTAESRLGRPLDAQHRDFLHHGNGWPEFYLSSSLLSAEQLGDGPAWVEANLILDIFYGELDEGHPYPSRAEVYPITHDESGRNVFAIWSNGPKSAGGAPVFWFPWSDTEPYDNFFEFFRMVYQEYEEEVSG